MSPVDEEVKPGGWRLGAECAERSSEGRELRRSSTTDLTDSVQSKRELIGSLGSYIFRHKPFESFGELAEGCSEANSYGRSLVFAVDRARCEEQWTSKRFVVLK